MEQKRTSSENALDPSVLEIIRENQLHADRLGYLILWCLIAFSMLMLIFSFFTEEGIWGTFLLARGAICVAFLGLCQFVSQLVYRKRDDDNRWYRHFIVIVLAIFALYASATVATFAVNLVLPLLLSCRYYDKRFTLRVAALSLLCLPASTFTLTALNMCDPYFLVFPDEGQSGYLPFFNADLFLDVLPYDFWATFANVLLYDTSAVGIALILSSLIAYTYADQGLNSLIEQAEIAQRDERRRNEIALASQVRRSVLSNNFLIAPDYVDLHAMTISPRHIGGSFYDFAAPEAACVGFAIGETESNDQASMLRMMESVSMFRGLATTAINIGGIVRTLSDNLRAYNREQHRLFLFTGVLNLETGVLSYVDADFPGFLLMRDGHLIKPNHRKSPAIGSKDVHKFHQNNLMLAPGDLLVFYTRGLLKNRNQSDEALSQELIEHRIAQSTQEELSAEDICKSMLSGQTRDTYPETWEEDCTIMAMRFLQPNTTQRRVLRGKDSGFDTFAAFVVTTDVEFNSLLSLYPWTLMNVSESGFLSYRAQFERDGKIYELVMVRLSDMGMVAAADLTTNIIWRFHPQYILCVGIIAGLRAQENTSHLGDVIVGSMVFNYSTGRYVQANQASIVYGSVGFEPKPEDITVPTWLIDALRTTAASKDCRWHVHFGPIACGTSVVANSEICEKQVLSLHPNTVGLDMESFGVAHACKYAPDPKPLAITVKGISDFADNQKSYEHQHGAAEASCSFALFAVERFLPDRW